MNELGWKLALGWLICVVVVAALAGIYATHNGAAAMGYSLSCSFNEAGMILAAIGGYIAPGRAARLLKWQKELPVWISLIGAVMGLVVYFEVFPMPKYCARSEY